MTQEQESLKVEVVPEEAPPPKEKAGPVLVAQFVLVPVLIIGVCVAIFLAFSWLTGEGKTAADYLNEVKYNSRDRRWQAAFELSKFLTYAKDPNVGRSILPDVIKAFEDARKGDPDAYDPRIRQYLALAIGRIGDASAVPALLEGLSDPDNDTRLFCIRALGTARDDSAIAPLIQSMQSEDAAVRTMTVYVLGNYSGPDVLRALTVALQDPAEDVRWNAALGLAKQGDSAGRDVILQLLDRAYLDKFARLSEQDRADVMINALRAIKALKDPSFIPALKKLSESDPHTSVRQAALEALAAISK